MHPRDVSVYITPHYSTVQQVTVGCTNLAPTCDYLTNRDDFIRDRFVLHQLAISLCATTTQYSLRMAALVVKLGLGFSQ